VQTTKYISSTSLRAIIEPELIASVGTVSITVFNPNGGESVAKPLIIGEPVPVPVITSLNPNQVKPGGEAFFLYVTGSNFVTNSVIQWNGIAQATKYFSSTSLRTVIETEMIALPGTVAVTVLNPDFGGSESTPQSLIIGTVGPKITVARLNNTLILGWPAEAIGFKLESNPVLPATNWLEIAGSEATNSVSIPIGVGSQIYRLKR
jgi:hypothetical protein